MKTTITVERSPLPLPPGTYRLTREVTNPRSDGRIQNNRTNNWESWKTWPEGMLFIVDDNPHGLPSNRIYVYGGYYKVERDDARFPVLLEYLEIVTENPSMFLERISLGSGAGSAALAVLDELKIPLETIQQALDAIDARESEFGS